MAGEAGLQQGFEQAQQTIEARSTSSHRPAASILQQGIGSGALAQEIRGTLSRQATDLTQQYEFCRRYDAIREVGDYRMLRLSVSSLKPDASPSGLASLPKTSTRSYLASTTPTDWTCSAV
jgi:hypothetical protein